MTTRITEAQYPLISRCKLTKANLGAGNGYEVVLPPGAIVTRVIVGTQTAFDSGTTATVTVGDGSTTFANAVDVKTAGNETVSNTPKRYPTGGTISITAAETGTTATTGDVEVVIEHIVENRGNEQLV